MTRYLGIDLGGTNIKSVILAVDDDGGGISITAEGTSPTDADLGPEAVIDRVIEAGRHMISGHGPVAAAGLGVPGLFDPASGIVKLFPNLPGPWTGQALRQPVADGLGTAVTLINDARAFSLAESTLGAAQGCSTVVCLALGTGIGGGVVIDGRLHLGAWGVGGEIGHQTVDPTGPMCGCGNRGCLEAFARADALAEIAGQPDAEAVYRAAAEGDQASLAAINQVAEWIGIGIANVVTVLGPDRIVIGGGISAAGSHLLEPIRRAVAHRVTLVPTSEIEIVAAQLGSIAGAVGAALIAGRG